jgi:hypothetical protein
METESTIQVIKPYFGKNERLYVNKCFDGEWISFRSRFIPDFEQGIFQSKIEYPRFMPHFRKRRWRIQPAVALSDMACV